MNRRVSRSEWCLEVTPVHTIGFTASEVETVSENKRNTLNEYCKRCEKTHKCFLNPLDIWRLFLHRSFNTYNRLVWTRDNPHAYIEEPLHAPKFTVLLEVTAWVNLGSYIHANSGWKTSNVTENRYIKMLKDYVLIFLSEKRLSNTITFIQDGCFPVSPHVWSSF